MNFSEIKELIKLINDSDLSYFEMQDEKDYIKIDKSMCRNYINTTSDSLNKLAITDSLGTLELEESTLPLTTMEDNINSSSETIISEDENFEYIKSPIVGTYYKAVSPTSDAFVSIGKRVNKGDVVCIIEAMKLMNEISAEFDCEIVDILCEDGQMVQYGESLLKVRRV